MFQIKESSGILHCLEQIWTILTQWVTRLTVKGAVQMVLLLEVWTRRPPPHQYLFQSQQTWHHYLNVQSVSIMSFHQFCSAKAVTWCVVVAAPSWLAAQHAEDPSVISATLPWKRLQAPCCSPANTPHPAALCLCSTHRKQTMKNSVNIGRTPVLVRAPVVSGRVLLSRWCHIWWWLTSPSLLCKVRILCSSLQTSTYPERSTGSWCKAASVITSCWCSRNRKSLMGTHSSLQSSNWLAHGSRQSISLTGWSWMATVADSLGKLCHGVSTKASPHRY